MTLKEFIQGPFIIIVIVIVIFAVVFGPLIYTEEIETYAKVVHKVELSEYDNDKSPVILVSRADVKIKGSQFNGKRYKAEVIDKDKIDSIKTAHEYLINKDIELFLETFKKVETVKLGRKSDL